MYQVYITGIVAIVALVFLSATFGDDKVGPTTVTDIKVHGPAVLGVLVALALFVGLRSGSRGGPLALEQADVRFVLLSPVDRGVALRGPAWRQFRFLCFVGAAVGASIGQLALRRLPGNPAEWMATGALFGVIVVSIGFGAALVAAGTGLRQWLATVLGGATVVWSLADVFEKGPTAPGSFVGRLPIWALHVDPIALVGLPVAAALVAGGMWLVSGTSLEAAERRTALVGQLKFAVTLQDLRTVLVLRRQLAQERPRSRPWIPAWRGRRARYPVFQRGLRSVLRWPVSRLVRVVVLAAVAGLAFRGVWSGTTPLLLLAGLALWIAALDAAEPLGQEVDHPGRTDGFPMIRGQLFLLHLPIIGIVSVLTGLVAGAVAAGPWSGAVPLGPALLVGFAAGMMAACGAVVSVIQGAPDAVDVMAITTPEIAGSRTVIRTVWPPGLAVLGTLPLLAARAAAEGISNPTPAVAASRVISALSFVVVIFGGWVRFRDDIHQWMRDAAEQMSPTKAVERAAAEREAEADREKAALADSRRAAGLPDDPDDDGEGDDAPAPKPKPKPRPTKPKVTPSEAAPGVQGGTSAKPMGRRRDQKR